MRKKYERTYTVEQLARRVEYGKEYRVKNKEVIAQRKKDDVAKYGEARRAKQKAWRISNSDKVKKDHSRWFQENKETIYEKRKTCAWTQERQAAYFAEYKIRNKDRIRETLRKYLDGNNHHRIKHKLLGRVGGILKRAKGKAKDRHIDFLGCTRSFFVAHIESLFKEGMMWENYGKGGWEIDHIKPCISFDMTIEEEMLKCFHYTNLQPLWWRENISKGKKMSKP
jgi:hypothetical protein